MNKLQIIEYIKYLGLSTIKHLIKLNLLIIFLPFTTQPINIICVNLNLVIISKREHTRIKKLKKIEILGPKNFENNLAHHHLHSYEETVLDLFVFLSSCCLAYCPLFVPSLSSNNNVLSQTVIDLYYNYMCVITIDFKF